MKTLLIFSFCFGICFCATYYVAINGDDNNNGSQGSPFLTLNKASFVADINDTIIIGPGDFGGSGNYEVIFSTFLTVQGSGMEDTTIYCDDSDGQNYTGMTFFQGGILRNLAIIHCSPAIIVDDGSCSGPSMYISNVDFSDNEFGISQLSSTFVSVENSTFYNLINGISVFGDCLEDTYLEISNSNFTQIQSSSSIYFVGNFGASSLSITQSIFQNSEASTSTGPQGPAISVTGASVNIINSIFANNTFGGNGAALYVSGGNLIVYGSIFAQNIAMNGGAIYVTDLGANQAAQVMDTSLIANSAKLNGGALYCNACTFTTVASLIEQNVANVGGAGFCSKSCKFMSSNNTLVDNISTSGDPSTCF